MQAVPALSWNVLLCDFECTIFFYHVLHFLWHLLWIFLRKKIFYFPLLYSVCCYFLIGLKLFPLIHFLTHAAESCLLACFCSCKNQIEVFSTVKAQLWEDGCSTYMTSSDCCVNGSSAIQVLSVKETGYTSYISAQIHHLANSQDYKVPVNMD